MKATNPFKGKIEVIKRNVKQTLISFEVPVEDLKMEETLMAKFKRYKFSNEEKRKLSLRYREELSHYKHLNPNTISLYADKFIDQLCKDTTSTIHIKASKFGAFICLAAIASGKLPKDKKITFDLSSCPVAIFPKKLVKAKRKQDAIDLNVSQSDSWIKDFQSLTEVPGHICDIVNKAAA